MMLSVTDRVSRGAELLDREVPGWVKVISIDDLEMGESSWCVLGQIFGKFGTGEKSLGISDCGGELGFELSGTGDYSDGTVEREWSLLSQAWIDEIERRRGVTKS